MLAADPLDVEHSDASRWEESPGEERLFWRLVYLLESQGADAPDLRERAARIVACLERTRSADATHELLPVVIDQPRLCEIIAKHRGGVISRTGFLSVLAESGYPEHVKLWLQHASGDALQRLCERLAAYQYDLVAAAFEVPPA